jgi:pyridoxal phosphate enzyme (YggS family)
MIMPTEESVLVRLQVIRARICAAAKSVGRSEDSVTLVAISKFQSVSVIEAALKAGQSVFGESRIQEANQKWPALNSLFAKTELHLIGRLQSNKVRAAVRLFDVIQTLDRIELARELEAEMKRSGRRPSFFIQVNTGNEPQKGGVPPELADRLIAECRERHRLPILGLMCIPPAGIDPEPHFDLLRRIAERNALEMLSMGMSADFETAIKYGATHIRVGSAIFGERS